MSNRRQTKAKRRGRFSRPKCEKCGSRSRRTQEYDDAFLHICGNPKCRFPVLEPKKVSEVKL